MSTGVRWRGAGAPRNGNGKRQLLRDELDTYASLEEELRWRPEARIINKYAVVMAYIRMGMKGVSALVLLWATVVLLGGFVSDLRKKDFCYLTIIAFVQAAGLSDVMGDARLVFFEDWLDSLISNIASWGTKHRTQLPMGQSLRRLIQILILKIIDLCLALIFLGVVYFAYFGPILCFVLSLFRVRKQDYGIADGDASKANMKPALNLFYYVSTAHSIIYLLCMIIEDAAEERFVHIISQRHGFGHEVLGAYLLKTKQMCLNNPASTMSWNLITYGADLLDSQLPEDYANGARVLTMLIDQDAPLAIRRLLIRSPRQRIHKLIGTLAWRSPDEQEMRWLAARIVEHLAGDLKLAHFSGALECISSLFDTSYHNSSAQEALYLPFLNERSKQRKRKHLLFKVVDDALNDHGSVANIGDTQRNGGALEQDNNERENFHGTDEDLVLPGLRILENLAHDGHNCTLIYNTKALLSKIVAPVSSNELVEDIKSNAAWTKVVDGSLKVVSRLMGSAGSIGIKMCRLIANNSNAVKNMEALLGMDTDGNSGIIELQVQTIDVLTQLALHHPTRTSAERLIQRALQMFLTTDWMRDYLEDEKRKINQPSVIPQNTLSRPTTRTRLNNFVKMVSGAWAEEKMVEQAIEAGVKTKMKEAKYTANRLKEKVGEALAMLSSDSEAIKSFTICKDDDVHCLTELLDSNIKTIECKINATDSVEIDINMGCRISAAIILRHLCNYVKEPTLRKVLAELLPVQAELSTTPWCWERLLPTCCRNDIENQMDGGQGQGKPSASQSHHIQQCEERRLQAELISLVTAIRPNNNLDFAAILMSQKSPVALEDFVMRLKKMVEDNMYATPACLAIQKLTCEMVIELIQHDQNVELIDKHNIISTLLKASKAMARLESNMLFAGVDRDCHGVPLKPLLSVIAKRAEDILTQRKQDLFINIAPAGVP